MFAAAGTIRNRGKKHSFAFGSMPVRRIARTRPVPAGAPTYSVEPVLWLAVFFLL